MRIIHDITAGIHEGMLTYPGDPVTHIKRVAKIEDGAPANLSEYSFGSHAGTHIDPPFHLDPAGAKADEVSLDALIGPAAVVEAVTEVIGAAFIERQDLRDTQRVLFKTRGSGLMKETRFTEDFTRLDKDAAEALVRLGVRLVGIDYLSVEFGDPGLPVHRTLLDAGVVILEGLDLSLIRPGRYELVCLPLKVIGGDGAPARAVLLEYA